MLARMLVLCSLFGLNTVMTASIEHDYKDYRFICGIVPLGNGSFVAALSIRLLGALPLPDVECPAPSPFISEQEARAWAIQYGKDWVDEKG